MKIVALRLKTARKRAGLKQVQVFRKIGLNNKTLSNYENDVCEPDMETLRKLAELYEVSVDWILDNEENGFIVPESDFDRFIKYMEEKHQVKLSGDPVLNNSLRQLVETVALTKKNEQILNT